MFSKILVANRDEIALRIIRAGKELGVRTVTVCSQVDRRCLYVLLANKVVCLGIGSTAASSKS